MENLPLPAGAGPDPLPLVAAPPEPRRAGDPTAPLGVGGAILAFLAAFFGGQAIGGVVVVVLLIAGVVGGWLPPPTSDPQWVLTVFAHPVILLSAAVASSGSFVLTAWLACRIGRRSPVPALGLVRAPALAVVGAMLGVGAVGILVDELVTAFRTLVPSLTFGVLEAFSNAARAEGLVLRPLTFVCMTFVPGFSEELFFRGLLQRSFAARLGPLAGIALAALVFGLVHVDPPQALGAMLTGGFLGWVAYRARSIVPAIAAHVTNNALAWLGSNIDSLREMAERQEHMPAGVLALAAVLGIGSIAVVWVSTRPARAG